MTSLFNRQTRRRLFFTCLLAATLTGALTARSENANEISQDPSGIKVDNANLVEAEASFDQGNLTIVVKAVGDPQPGTTRVYLDTDVDGSTGYRHDWRKDEGEGADFMVQDGTLSKWDGGNAQTKPDWEPADGNSSVVVNSEGDHMLTFSIPLTSLKVKGGDKIRIFIESTTDNDGKTLDMIPRDAPWSVKVPLDALDLSVPS